MPELPEVETTCRGLDRALRGARIERVEQHRADLRFPMPKNLAQELAGRKIADVRRRAKYILVDLDNGQSLLLHLGMSGSLVVGAPDVPPGKHDHVILHCANKRSLRFNDPRRFGMLDLLPTADVPEHRLLKNLGVEPLDCHAQSLKPEQCDSPSLGEGLEPAPCLTRGGGRATKNALPKNALTIAYLTQKLRGKKADIKAALLDQRIIVGLGNIYVCEALFHARIAPKRRAGSLKQSEIAALIPAIRKVLNAAIKAGGSSLRDYVQSDGALGCFQNNFAVYDCAGKKCPGCTCGKPAIKRVIQSGRSTFFCPVRQG